MIENKLKNLIERLRGGSEQDILDVKDKLRTYRDSVLKQKVLEMEPIKWILDYCDEEVNVINEELLSKKSKDMKDTERDRLLDRRDLFIWFSNFFKPIDEKELEKWIDEQLEYLKSLGL